MRRAAQGDEAAFATLVARYDHHLYRFVMHYVPTHEDACDVLQQVYLKAYRALPLVRLDLRLAPWLRRIATNVALDLLRSRRRRPEGPWGTAGEQVLLAQRDPSADPEQHTLRQETRRLVQTVLTDMRPHHRAALTMYEMSGMSCAEIGDQLGMTQAGVKSLLFRAREDFRRLYAARSA
ncbi:MAG: sigma-70 family RNA polymerase sigma factor [Chloroflexi bacterium]|nr:sigma-70 family RNA polymerase sigma factor [Chloroflexota bacterium]